MEKKDYIFPFFWQHGESEEKLREYMKVINESNLNAVCVESRPHPDFCGPRWWKDMEIILDEAKKRDMRVWILDDSHFPTGYANGAAENAPLEQRRQSIYTWSAPVKNKKRITVDIRKAGRHIKMPIFSKIINLLGARNVKFDDDRLLGAAVTTAEGRIESAEAESDGTKVTVKIPDGAKKVHITYLSRNFGIHRKYINMLDKDSCRMLIDAVYEPHYQHFGDEFGKTIAGFFSDEPELGNGYYFSNQVKLGNDVDQPWSRELEKLMAERLGDEWKTKLVLLWDNEAKSDERELVRYTYMDLVTRLVEKDFSCQIGSWCEEHGVEYIGHMIEDNNQHSRTGASLGHYFRGLAGQHMAGIDDIGGQVIPQKEDAPAEGPAKLTGRDGEFYHYMLGRLGASLAAVDPRKKGRCMCEIFGNYGWDEGPRLEKQLADHFMVRGVNRFVPHAFSPKEYPDKDCPPHFYANGHNPQYRAFGYVMKYMNRICELISDGQPLIHTAILYSGDMEWMGDTMLGQKPARVLEEHQIPFHFIPCDVFEDPGQYATNISGNGLEINGNRYTSLLIPEGSAVPKVFSDIVGKLEAGGCSVLFINSVPDKAVGKDGCYELTDKFGKCKKIALEDCYKHVEREVILYQDHPRLHVYHYIGRKEIYYLVNEDSERYEGKISVPYIEKCAGYDAWEDRYFRMELSPDKKCLRTEMDIILEGGESIILIVGGETAGQPGNMNIRKLQKMVKTPINNWEMSKCKAKEYPAFSDWMPVSKFFDLGKKEKKFSGFIAYRTMLSLQKTEGTVLEITDAGEDVEVFVNGVSAGIKVLPPFRFDISEILCPGDNEIRIEVATTLERERGGHNCAPIGILGTVNLYQPE